MADLDLIFDSCIGLKVIYAIAYVSVKRPRGCRRNVLSAKRAYSVHGQISPGAIFESTVERLCQTCRFRSEKVREL